ncbi:DNA cytosine methyltransferase [Tenacibaculum maritimum]|uniref:DNA cytosine methyltransferase n=1 Tax=Tenacibaculum maritimum TaxID=107401 RepID=UPI00388D3701
MKLTLTQGTVFSGIGGPELAAHAMGWKNVFHCDINEFGKRVISHYWPKSIGHGNIKETNFNIYRGRIDILTGGFPCQPYSAAGKRLGKNDDRHLWPEFARAIREIQPRWIVGENVRGIVNWNGGLVLSEVQDDLEAEGYEVQCFLFPSASIGAANIRERVWICAYNGSLGRKNVQDNKGSSSYEIENAKGRSSQIEWREKETNVLDPSRNTFLQFQEMYGQPAVFNVGDEFSPELDFITISKWYKESITAAGNAINPRAIMQIFKAIEKYEQIKI